MKTALILIAALVLMAVLYYTPGSGPPRTLSYAEALAHTRMVLASERWPSGHGAQVVATLGKLISELTAIGDAATEAEKLACFKRADAQLHQIYREKRPIPPGEIEQLDHAGGLIAMVAGLLKHAPAGKSPLTVTRNQ